MLEHSPLGKTTTDYEQAYSPDILFRIPRARGRVGIGLDGALPFTGVDLWTGYELSWLNPKNKPCVAVGEFRFPASATHIVESKSFKLYLNAFNGTTFADTETVRLTLERDLSRAAGAVVAVKLIEPAAFRVQTAELPGHCIDAADLTITRFDVHPDYLVADADAVVEETLVSHLLRSNCPVTGQPDWASVMVRYRGPRIDRAALLQYIISFRRHTGFHEQCVEQIFVDLKARCRCEKLTVYARYTRRGGLDINPFRSDFEDDPENSRNYRQ